MDKKHKVWSDTRDLRIGSALSPSLISNYCKYIAEYLVGSAMMDFCEKKEQNFVDFCMHIGEHPVLSRICRCFQKLHFYALLLFLSISHFITYWGNVNYGSQSNDDIHCILNLLYCLSFLFLEWFLNHYTANQHLINV